MLSALIHGRLVHVEEAAGYLQGRIVLNGDTPVQFAAKRGAVKRDIRLMSAGMPIAAAGDMRTSVRFDKNGKAYVHYELLITSIVTAQPSPLRRGWRALFGASTND